ncbi:MAG: hypothetical protein VX498_14895, partial [Myxococcota bacterium]|nr:hypothetical protein [Myxococcota bacterium]
SLGRVEEALIQQQSLQRQHEAQGSTDFYVHEELGESLLLLGRHDEARPHFQAAWEGLSQDSWLRKQEPERIQRLHELGKQASE